MTGRIVVAGGGIGGLAAAVALHQRGRQVVDDLGPVARRALRAKLRRSTV
ncbi:hypothetical protein [Lentzea sp. NPDC004782]